MSATSRRRRQELAQRELTIRATALEEAAATHRAFGDFDSGRIIETAEQFAAFLRGPAPAVEMGFDPGSEEGDFIAYRDIGPMGTKAMLNGTLRASLSDAAKATRAVFYAEMRKRADEITAADVQADLNAEKQNG